MKKTLIAGSICLCLIACTDNADNTGNHKAKEQTTAETSNSTGFQHSFPALFNALKQKNVTADSFAITETGQLEPFPSSPINMQHLQPFKKLLIYNSDSTQAIDLFSYNYILAEKEGKPVAEAAEPDTEIALLNFKKNTRKRIWYSGPATAIVDAKWVGPNEVELLSIQEDEKGERKPIIWKISLTKNTIDTYKYNHPVALTATDYLNKRFNSVNFR